VYLLGDVLIDAGTRQAERRIMRQLAGRPLSAHALTHAHPRPPGLKPRRLRAAGHPVVVRRGRRQRDGDARRRGRRRPAQLADLGAAALPDRAPHPVGRFLGEGDEVAGFTLLETPGHSPGHVAFWRESDRVLVLATCSPRST